MTRTAEILGRLAALRAGGRRRLAAVAAPRAAVPGDAWPPRNAPRDRVGAIRARRNPVILDRRDRFVFFPNSKVAQRSIARRLLADRAVVRKDDVAAWDARFARVDDGYLERTFTFTIVRNPFDRVVSAFFYLHGARGREAFEEFVVDVLAREGPAHDPHFEPQADGLFHDGRLLVEHVGLYETLARSWREIAARIDAPAELPHVGRSARAASYAGYYTPGARAVVERLYHEDLVRFGYAFEDGAGGEGTRSR